MQEANAFDIRNSVNIESYTNVKTIYSKEVIRLTNCFLSILTPLNLLRGKDSVFISIYRLYTLYIHAHFFETP